MNYSVFLLPVVIIGLISVAFADSIIILPTENNEIDQPRYFAKLENNIITNVIVADPDFILNHMDGIWIETWMNHDNPRKNYAGKGHSYNMTLDAFVPKKPFDSWLLNTTDATWVPPIKKPDGNYHWNEEIPDWVKNE